METRGNEPQPRPMRSRLAMTALLIAALFGFANPHAQVAPAQIPLPFDIIGFIQDATVDAPDDVLSGGTITVNDTTIIVPRNTVLQMPAATLTWQEVFAKAPAGYAPTRSGLAMNDVPRPALTYEVHIMGNRVVTATSDQFIAGLMFLSQQSLNAGAGFVNFIDYAAGELRVGGLDGDGTTGARVRINDPIGRFGRADSPDVRFSIDEDSPTVRTETGYPMCLPRTDPAVKDDVTCPKRNRPKDSLGHFLSIINFPRPVDPLPSTSPDSRIMMPFEIGDYITYSGNLYNDAAGQPYISAWAITANIGAFTAPGSKPAYVAIDVMILGVGGIPIPGLPQEAVVRTRVEGFTTDPTRPVMVFAIDVDPCTGETSNRFYALVQVDQGPPKGAVLGRWRWRPITFQQFLPPTREMRAVSLTGVVSTPVANGLYAGQYHAPNFTFIPPENRAVGNRPIPINFQDFPFLTEGSGPYPDPTSPGRIDQLSPWPGSPAPSPVVCGADGTTFRAPIADAGLSQQAGSGDNVTLDGSASADSNYPPLPLSFSWTQTSGPAVVLDNADSPMPTFTAPTVALGAPSQTLVFDLTVRNVPANLRSTASVTVTVNSTAQPVDTIDVPTATFRMRRSILTVNANSSDPNAVLTLKGFGIMQATDPPVPGHFQLVIVGVNLETLGNEVTITSNLGGVIVVPLTFLQ